MHTHINIQYLDTSCDHLGNVRVVSNDIKLRAGNSGPFRTTIYNFANYYPFGMQYTGTEGSYDANGDYRYGAGGQEKLNEISGSGNHYTAHFWEMDPRLGIRWNRDPKPNPSVSDYAIFADNPIMITDILGDSCVVNNKGTIVHFDPNDNDKRVFAQLDGKLSLIGTLGGKIDANNIYANLLNENMKEAKDLWSPLTFREYVKNHGKWDYKNDDRSIFGLANDGKTKFLFQNKEMESQDIGNHHFGVVVKAYGLFPGEQFILAQAGNAQITSGTSKKRVATNFSSNKIRLHRAWNESKNN